MLDVRRRSCWQRMKWVLLECRWQCGAAFDPNAADRMTYALCRLRRSLVLVILWEVSSKLQRAAPCFTKRTSELHAVTKATSRLWCFPSHHLNPSWHPLSTGRSVCTSLWRRCGMKALSVTPESFLKAALTFAACIFALFVWTGFLGRRSGKIHSSRIFPQQKRVFKRVMRTFMF